MRLSAPPARLIIGTLMHAPQTRVICNRQPGSRYLATARLRRSQRIAISQRVDLDRVGRFFLRRAARWQHLRLNLNALA